MTELAQTADAYAAALAKVRTANMQLTRFSVGAALILGEKLAMMAQSSDEIDDVRKAFDSFTRKAEVPEKQEAAKATATAAAAILQIILDDTPQVAPTKRARAAIDVEDAIEVPISPATPPSPPPAHADPALEELTWGTDL
jgi:hypothetical protein